jgi:hypothetical protein
MSEIIKVVKKGKPVFVKKVKVSDLDPSKISHKFKTHDFPSDTEVYVKVYENGDIDFRGKKEEYRLIPLTAEVVE